MATYKWVISNVACIPFMGGQYDVVSKIWWERQATDGVHTVTYFGITDIPTDDLTHFTPYTNLTQDEMYRWLDKANDVAWLNSILDVRLQDAAKSQSTNIPR